MPYIHPSGSPSSRIWVITDTPLSTDIPKGYMFSGGAGWVFRKMLEDAGISDYYITCRKPDTDNEKAFRIIESELNQYKPPFILALGSVGSFLCEAELKTQSQQKTYRTQLGKYVGSLLTAPKFLTYPHYIMPVFDIEKFLKDWTERNVTTYFDLQKIKLEYDYWKTHGQIQNLPFRQLIYKDLFFDDLISHIRNFSSDPILSVDIETVYPRDKSIFKPHPGYPVTIGIANSPSFGISFNLFRDSDKETLILWRELDRVLSNAPHILGQNFFNFDSKYLKMLGFGIEPKQIIDTIIRHHILWPELPHKLQFQTRQYTREPYYKDEGHNWNLKDMQKLRRYNALDVTITYEVYLEQENEFKERSHLAA